jgi:uncharacterized protein (DUF736 family)
MSGFDNTNSCALFKETNKKQESHKDYSGSANFEGTDFWASGWVKQDSNGATVLSLAFDDKAKAGVSGSGKLAKNPNKSTERHPDYIGEASLDGNEFRLAGWKRTAKTSGKEFISVKIEPQGNEKPQSEAKPEVVTAGVSDDEIPF